jgi:hypothetical protein
MRAAVALPSRLNFQTVEASFYEEDGSPDPAMTTEQANAPPARFFAARARRRAILPL